MKTCLMSSFTLDGCISEILLRQIYNFDTTLAAGYGKMKTYFQEGKFYENKHGESYDKMIFSSIQIPGDIMDDLMIRYGDKLSVIDHHPNTKVYHDAPIESRVTWSPTESSAKQVLKAIESVGKVDVKGFRTLANLANVYEMWKPDAKEWGLAYALNCMFWHHGYFNFRDIYVNGLSDSRPLFTDEDKSVITGIVQVKQDKIKQAVKEDFDDGQSVLFLNADSDVISDFALQKEYAHYDLYFILYGNYQGKQVIAVRVNTSFDAKMTAVEAIDKVCAGRKDVFGGGFNNVGSITVHQEKKLDSLLDIIEGVASYLRTGSPATKVSAPQDVPF